MKHDKHEQEPFSIYESQPPTWLPKSHRTADIGEPLLLLSKFYRIVFIHFQDIPVFIRPTRDRMRMYCLTNISRTAFYYHFQYLYVCG